MLFADVKRQMVCFSFSAPQLITVELCTRQMERLDPHCVHTGNINEQLDLRKQEYDINRM